MRRLLAALAGTLLAACATSALAPQGGVRIALNVSNPVLAQRSADGVVTGLTVDLARVIAEKLGAEPVFVTYANAGALLEGARRGEWDVGFTAIDAARADVLAFSRAYMEVNVGYVVPDSSAFRAIADVDREGAKVGVGQRNTADLHLTRELRHAKLVRAPDTLPGALSLVRGGEIDAYADNYQRLLAIQQQVPGQRILPGRFMAVQHAVAVPRDKASAVPWLDSVVEGVKRDGMLSAAIARHGLKGVEVAP